ncbi:MAG: UDP-2,4-diacetamido-2,4,6-trideoxy-beta-L-altropyranose hydrolase [Planctomycetota bacterium]|jgi:UDP-2,4-diacetamido-2,4,6-trideoxy-beta-L-altropyranose hydrolase
MSKVLFRVDAGQILHVAMGHAFRCVSLAEDLKDKGEEVVFLMREDPLGNDFVRSRGFQVLTLSSDRDITQSTAKILDLEPNLVVFDLLHLEEAETRLIHEARIPVVVIDDLGQKTVHADLVVNGNILDSHHEYAGHIGNKLLGPSFIVLGRQFDGRRNERVNPELDKILVTMGGADPMGFTPTVVKSLVENNIGKSITVVQGPAFGSRSDMKNIHFGMKTQVRVQENVPDLSMLMVAADLVVSAGGRTAYELAATGTPSVLVPTADHEVEVAQALVASGAAKAVAVAAEECIRSELAVLVEEAADLATRQRMAQAGLRLVDGKGRERVTNALMELGQRSVGTGWGKS